MFRGWDRYVGYVSELVKKYLYQLYDRELFFGEESEKITIIGKRDQSAE
jgi:hypothetical protein